MRFRDSQRTDALAVGGGEPASKVERQTLLALSVCANGSTYGAVRPNSLHTTTTPTRFGSSPMVLPPAKYAQAGRATAPT
jgi:hypothetical protein